jgi:hypothetical protein
VLCVEGGEGTEVSKDGGWGRRLFENFWLGVSAALLLMEEAAVVFLPRVCCCQGCS